MRVLVLGGTGFIGQHLVSILLTEGHGVGVVHRPGSDKQLPAAVSRIVADRQDLPNYAVALRAFRPDVVVDLILSSGRHASQLVKVFAGHSDRVIATTSGDVYRSAAVLHGFDIGPLEPVPLTETSPLRRDVETYPAERIAALQRIFSWLDGKYDKVAVERILTRTSRLPATILRLPMIYGPGDHLHRLRPLLKRMDDGRPAIILSESAAQWRVTRGYVENVAAAIALAIGQSAAAGRIYNVGEPTALSELEWAREVASAAGWSGRLVTLPDDRTPDALRIRGRLEQHWVMDTTRIRSELGYAERWDRVTALSAAVDWERSSEGFDTAIDYSAEDAALNLLNLDQ